MKIEAMSIGIKADGKLYLALLDGVDLNVLAQLIATIRQSAGHTLSQAIRSEKNAQINLW